MFKMNLLQCAFSALPASIVVYLYHDKQNESILWSVIVAALFFCLLTATHWWTIRKYNRDSSRFPDLTTMREKYRVTADIKLKKMIREFIIFESLHRFMLFNYSTNVCLFTLVCYIFFPELITI